MDNKDYSPSALTADTRVSAQIKVKNVQKFWCQKFNEAIIFASFLQLVSALAVSPSTFSTKLCYLISLIM